MADLQITAAKTNRSLVNASPDRAAGLRARRMVLADPVLLFYRRLLDSALAEAKRTRDGKPTDMALKTLHWIQVPNHNLDMADPDDKVLHLLSFSGACEMLSLNERAERKRMLNEIKAAYAESAAAGLRSYVKGRMASVLTCAGLGALAGQQYVLGLVDVEDYDEIAGVERPDPPARPARTTPRPRSRRAA